MYVCGKKQVTLAFNVFDEGVVQRMPRCRRGYVHVVNNDFRYWEIYVIGGSDNPTINSQGNRYIAPANPFIKEVSHSWFSLIMYSLCLYEFATLIGVFVNWQLVVGHCLF